MSSLFFINKETEADKKFKSPLRYAVVLMSAGMSIKQFLRVFHMEAVYKTL